MSAVVETEGTTATLAASVEAYTYDALPDPVRAIARCCLLDWLGAAIAGAGEPEVVALAGLLAGSGPATVLGGDRASARAAARINGTAGHVLDYDDVIYAMDGHPSAPVIPAALAAAEITGASGAQLLAAIVAGIEVECRIGAAVAPSHYAHGFHATATVGTFGAAVAAARLLGLDRDQTVNALGLAGISAAGLKSAFGTSGKALQVGHAAAEGLLAAQLAARGATGPAAIVEGEQGFAATQSTTFDPSAVTAPGAPWHIRDALFKLHASCYLTHATIEGVLALRADGLAPEDVEELIVHVGERHLTVCAIPEPTTPLEAKFSLRHTAALALVAGQVQEDAFTDAAIADPAVVALRDRVSVVAEADRHALRSRVVAARRGGGSVFANADTSRSTPDAELGALWDRLAGKLVRLAGPRLPDGAPERLVERVAAVADLREVGELLQGLGG